MSGAPGTAGTPSADYQTVARNSVVLLTRHVLLWGLNGLLVLFLPKYLGDEGLGRLQFSLSFVMLFSIGVALGARHFLIKEIARDRDNIQRYLGSAITLRLFAAAVVLGLIYFATRVFGDARDAGQLVYLAALWMVVTSFAALLASVLQGRERMSWAAMAEIAGKLTVVAVGIPVLVKGMGVSAYLAVLVLGAAVHCSLIAAFVARKFSVRLSVQTSQMKTLVVGGAPFLLMGFLLNVYAQVDVVMLKAYTSDAVVGWYAAASQLFGTVEFIPAALTTAMLPAMARTYITDLEALAKIARNGVVFGAMVVVPIAVGTSLLASELIDFLPYPDGFRNSAPLLMIMAFSIPVTAILTIFGTIAMASDRQGAWSLVLLGTVVLKVAVNVFAIPYFATAYGNGGIGGALTTVISELFMILASFKLMPAGIFDRWAVSTLSKVAGAGLVMAVAILAMKPLDMGYLPLAAASASVYVAAVLALRAVTRADLEFIRRVMTSSTRQGKFKLKGGPIQKEALL